MSDQKPDFFERPADIFSPSDRKNLSKNRPGAVTILKHLGLFILTFLSVSFIGSLYVGFGNEVADIGFMTIPVESDLWRGALFASLLLGFLTFHEFGHYFAAVYHNVKVSLPYYIPLPLGIGTLGAVIRIKEVIHDTKKLFDIGVAGPLAGFVVSILVLLIGFITLPDPSYVQNFSGHTELKEYVSSNNTFPDYITDKTEEGTLVVGNTIFYGFIASFFDNAPPLWELYHYPFLFAGWLGLFFTALNLMPVGQLDGGHILYSLIGYQNHKNFARVFYVFISVLAGIEVIPILQSLFFSFDSKFGTFSWIAWSAILYLLMSIAFKRDDKWIMYSLPASLSCSAIYIYFIVGLQDLQPSSIWIVWIVFITFLVKIEHPPVTFYRPLSPTRKVLGWLSMLIFILCISLNPLSVQ